jgi:hypothetical protein
MRSQLRRPDGGSMGRVKGLLHRESPQEESWTTAVNLIELEQNGSLPEKDFTANKKEQFTLSQGDIEEGSC